MMEIHKKTIIRVLILSLFFSFSVIFFSFSVILLRIRREKVNNSQYMYQYFQVDRSSNKSSMGLIEMPIEIGMDESGSFIFSHSKYSLISKLEEDEYQCSGACFCDTDSELRRGHNTLTLTRKGMIYLLTAVTSLVAMKKAREYFLEECEESFSENAEEHCPLENIRSEVYQCATTKSSPVPIKPIPIKMPEATDSKDPFFDSTDVISDDDGKTKQNEKDDMNIKRFYCQGSCTDSNEIYIYGGRRKKIGVPDSKQKTQKYNHQKATPGKGGGTTMTLKDILHEVGAVDLELKKFSDYEACEQAEREALFNIDCSGFDRMGKCFSKAKRTFLFKFLTPFCRKESAVNCARIEEIRTNKVLHLCQSNKKSISCREVRFVYQRPPK